MNETSVYTHQSRAGPMRRVAGVGLICSAVGLILMAAQGYRPLVVYSGSMSPTIRTGAVAVIKPVKATSLEVSDVIAVELEGTGHLVTHRIQSMVLVDGQLVFQTKGDANRFPDPQPFIIANSAGKVVFDIPWLGYAIVYGSNPLIRAVLVGIVAYLVLAGIRRRRDPDDAARLSDETAVTGANET